MAPNERPTLPNPLPASTTESRAAALRAFDTQAETFFAAAMAFCAGVLALGFLVAPV